MVVVIGCAIVASLLDGLRTANAQVIGWSAASASVAMAAFLWSSGSDIALQEVRTRVMSSLLLVALGVLLHDRRSLRVARIAVLISMLVAVVMNVWEVTHPLTFSIALGRSAGFYQNPNISGAAIIAGMLLALPAVPRRLREFLVLIAGAGILVTLSRGALLCWMISVALLVLFRGVRGPRLAAVSFVTIFAGMSLAATLLASGQLKYIGGGAEQFVRRRLSIGSSEQFNADVSASSRSHLAMRALEMFGERPFTGHGTGSTVEWREPESTHNIYARQLAEYGMLGAWLAPALLLIAWRGAHVLRREDRERHDVTGATSMVLVIFIGCWGLFSHNVLDDVFVLVSVATILSASALRARANDDAGVAA
jgi:O-antigen ligase